MAKVMRPSPITKVELPKVPTISCPEEAEIGIIYGGRKIGKTWLAADFPAPLILDLEHGGKFLKYHPKSAGIFLLPIRSISELRGAISALTKEDSTKLLYQTIVVDSLTFLNQWAEEEVVDELGQALGSQPFSADWGIHRMKMLRIIDALRTVGKRVILVAHEVSTDLPKPKTSLDISGKLKQLIPGRADWLGYLTLGEEGERIWKFGLNKTEERGSRYPQLQGKTLEASYEAFAREIGEIPSDASEA